MTSFMGKGDIKTKRGKIANGTYGTRRKRKNTQKAVQPAKKTTAKKKK